MAIITSATSVMLLAGVAFAQVGSMAPRAPELGTRAYGEVAQLGSGAGAQQPTVQDSLVRPGTAFTSDGQRALVVEHPGDGDRFRGEALTIRGSAPADWTVHLGTMSTVVDDAGHWEMTVLLAPGENLVEVSATSPDGSDQLDVGVTAHYDVAGSQTLTRSDRSERGSSAGNPAATGDETFSANHKYDQHHAPADVLWGTGTPGDTVSALSLYGNASTTVNDEGLWDLYIRFNDAPEGAPFEIIVESGAGGTAAFTFSWVELDDDAYRRSWSMRGQEPGWGSPTPPTAGEMAEGSTAWRPSTEPGGAGGAGGGSDVPGESPGRHRDWRTRTDLGISDGQAWTPREDRVDHDAGNDSRGDHLEANPGPYVSPREADHSPATPRTQPGRDADHSTEHH